MGSCSSIDLEPQRIVECRLCNSLDVDQSSDPAQPVRFRRFLACCFSFPVKYPPCAYAQYHDEPALSMKEGRNATFIVQSKNRT